MRYVDVLVLSTEAFAISTTTAQKVDYARAQIEKIVSAEGYALIKDSIDLRTSKRPDFLLPKAFFALLETEIEINICKFTVLKGDLRYNGWIYLVSNELGVITRNTENPTSEIASGIDGNRVELYLFKGLYEEELVAPSVADLHLTVSP